MRDTTQFLLEKFHQCRIVTTDSRNVLPGALFFALKGERFNGNTFAKGALEVGAGYAIVDDTEYYDSSDDRLILVENALKTLQDLARAYRDTFDIPVLGITGSNGKTTTKELITAVLRTEKNIHATSGNYNNHIGVPLTLLQIPDNTEIAVIEMGANQPGDIAELCEIAQPTLGLITNIGKAHLEKLKSLEGVMETKGALYEAVDRKQGNIFVNMSDHRVRELAKGKSWALTYGDLSANVYGKILNQTLSGMNLEISHTQWKVPIQMNTHLSGIYNLHNIEAAVAVGAYFGISSSHIVSGIESYIPQNNRSQVLTWKGITFWMDAYNANPSSMKAAIDHVFSIPQRKVALILGDMLEVGENEEQEHQKIGEHISSYHPIITIGIGPLMKHMIHHCSGNCKWFPDIETGKDEILQDLTLADLVLLKGSRGMKLELLIQEDE